MLCQKYTVVQLSYLLIVDDRINETSNAKVDKKDDDTINGLVKQSWAETPAVAFDIAINGWFD